MGLTKKWRLAGVNFDHFHMGDLLRQAAEHPQVEIVGLCDQFPERMAAARTSFGLPDERLFTDVDACLEMTRPDVVVLCPAASEHGDWVERVAPSGVHILMEKPFAGSLEEADRMMAAMAEGGGTLAINWPLVWDPAQQTAHRSIRAGMIGELMEFHHYGGNRGPLYHGAEKLEKEPTAAEKAASWFYRAEKGGGSLLDYMGYGATLGSWHMQGVAPLEICCMMDEPAGLEVDEHAVAVIRYASGLSKSETCWGTFTDPWVHQPQPRCGFVLKGRDGTIAIDDYGGELRVQTRQRPEGFVVPADRLRAPYRNSIEHFLHHLETGEELIGPLSLPISRLGQRIVDTACRSAREKRTLPLLK